MGDIYQHTEGVSHRTAHGARGPDGGGRAGDRYESHHRVRDAIKCSLLILVFVALAIMLLTHLLGGPRIR